MREKIAKKGVVCWVDLQVGGEECVGELQGMKKGRRGGGGGGGRGGGGD